MAAFRSGATASLSSAEMMIALTFWVVRSVMNGTWRSAFGSFGPTWMTVAAGLGGALVDAGLRGGEVLVDDVLRQVADLDRRCARRRAGAAGGDAGGRRGALEPPELEHAANTIAATLVRAIDRPTDPDASTLFLLCL